MENLFFKKIGSAINNWDIDLRILQNVRWNLKIAERSM